MSEKDPLKRGIPNSIISEDILEYCEMDNRIAELEQENFAQSDLIARLEKEIAELRAECERLKSSAIRTTISRNAGIALSALLQEQGLTIRAAAEKFSQSFREWHCAAFGIATLEEINAKIALLETPNNDDSLFNGLKAFPME